ncbi:hypothetical protein K458DRAFT_406605 [Lentithecium fluviatile CBS 122367]|uniref:Uncharacterized protein n=1 Tax=Lentithecium fluviatile CBS 122367 TaxID=1168545 RepID=A0A6G1ITE3_9PLEO|nr:hypothetical protein K458DRAFT_406605 [Lentithecium fluviatile CBS 122367]
MADSDQTPCCSSCKTPRTLWDFAHNHLIIVTPSDPDDFCIICHEPFNTILPDTGRRDIPVQVTRLGDCKHTYGLACLEHMWATYARKRDTAPGHLCMLDRTKWFSRKMFYVFKCTEPQKQLFTNLLSKNWQVDKDTARWFLFHEDEHKDLVRPWELRFIQQKSEFELCIRWAIEMRTAVDETMKMFRTEQTWKFQPPDPEEAIRHFGTAESSWAAFWKGKMDPFDWNDFQQLRCSHRIRLVTAALATAKGQALHAMIKEQLGDCREELNGQFFGERGEPSRIVIEHASQVAIKWGAEWDWKQMVMVRYVAVTLMCAELQRERGVVLENLPGFAGTGWRYMSWNPGCFPRLTE